MKIDSILLIRPKAKGKMEFPFGLLYIGTALKKKGYQVKIIDLHDQPEKESEIEEILSQQPNMMLGISSLSASYYWVKRFSAYLKKKNPNLKIVIGGHIAVMYELLLEKTCIDYICLGEGETILPNLIKAVNHNDKLKEVLGIAYKDKQIIKTGFNPLIKQFDMPDFSLVRTERYLIHPNQDRFFRNSQQYQRQTQTNDRLATVMFSRGCIGACTFCYRHIPGYRQGSIDWTWEYIMILYRDFGVKYFRIDDELFAVDRKWFDEFYEKIKSSNLGILFRISGLRVDVVDNSLLAKLKDMGCIAINYGIESGSQEILNRMNKQTTVTQNLNAIQGTLRHKMKVMAYIMLGYQGETKKTLLETLNMLLATNLRPKDISIFYTVPLPGTKLYYDCLKQGLIKDEEQFIEGLYTKIRDQYERYLIQLGNLTRDQLSGFRKKLVFLMTLKRFISVKSSLFKMIKKFTLAISYDSHFNKLFGIGAKILNKV